MFDVKVTPTSVYLNGEKLKRRYKEDSTRIIFYNAEFVVKLEREDDRNFYHQCEKENSLWHELPNRHKKYFAPILQYGHTKEYDYVVQPRLKIRMYTNKTKIYKGWDDGIGRMVEKYGFNDLLDGMCANWGFINNKPIIFDYGV